MLENMKGLVRAAEDKRQASVAELSSKHQKVNIVWNCFDIKLTLGYLGVRQTSLTT